MPTSGVSCHEQLRPPPGARSALGSGVLVLTPRGLHAHHHLGSRSGSFAQR